MELEKASLIIKTSYQRNPVRYEYHLTGTGHSLAPVLRAIAQWASTYISGARTQHKTGKK